MNIVITIALALSVSSFSIANGEEILPSLYHPNRDLGKDSVLRNKCYVFVNTMKDLIKENKSVEVKWDHDGYGVAEFIVIGTLSSLDEQAAITALNDWAVKYKVMAFRIDCYKSNELIDRGNNNFESLKKDHYISYFKRIDL